MNLSRNLRTTASCMVLLGSLLPMVDGLSAELPDERPLWAGRPHQDTIQYDRAESVRRPNPPAGSPSGSNRVFRLVDTPTYSIHRAPKAIANGVGLVICPGGGYREVWLDREGHDLAIWLQKRGVTSLVLKYRTNAVRDNDERAYPWDVYMAAVTADARQAIRILRAQAKDLNLDAHKIGISGFSAGGHLAISVALNLASNTDGDLPSAVPDFAGLFYPWLREEPSELASMAMKAPPMFIMNASDDTMTPAARCVDFYQGLLEADVSAELHVYATGRHGFDLGTGRGDSAALWPRSFMAWLGDIGLVDSSQ